MYVGGLNSCLYLYTFWQIDTIKKLDELLVLVHNMPMGVQTSIVGLIGVLSSVSFLFLSKITD